MTSTQPIRWISVGRAAHAPEADFLINMLKEHGIPAFQRRAAGVDVPDFLATGARDVLVPAEMVERAREVLTPDPESPDPTNVDW